MGYVKHQGLMHDLNITIPVAIHLDHGSSFEKCKEAIDAGFTSVMIDASHSPFEENYNIIFLSTHCS
jgi:fructose-bisphosphate aldolase class II